MRKGSKHSEETKKRISESIKGENHPRGMLNKKHTENTKKLMSNKSKRLSWWKGKKHTEESKRKISESLKGHVVLEETKIKMSQSNKGIRNGMFGKTHSKEYKSKLKNEMINGKASYILSFNRSPSKPQVELYNLVKIIDICPVLNFPVKEVNRNIDIALPYRKIAIEYDGSYWHQDEEKDRIRQEQLESLGWRFIRYRDRVPSLKELINDISNIS